MLPSEGGWLRLRNGAGVEGGGVGQTHFTLGVHSDVMIGYLELRVKQEQESEPWLRTERPGLVGNAVLRLWEGMAARVGVDSSLLTYVFSGTCPEC